MARVWPRAWRVLRLVLAASLPVAGLLALFWLPQLTGTTWAEVLHVLWLVPRTALAGLAVVWVAGLIAHTRLQTAALPGLSAGRALALNLSGSAIANGVPGGGAVSTAATWAMARSWGFSGSAFAVYTMVTTVAVAFGKVLMPVVAVGLLAAVGGGLASGPLRTAGLVAAGVLAGAVLLLAAGWLLTGRIRTAPTRGQVRGLWAAPVRLLAWWGAARAATAAVLRSGWRAMLVSVLGYSSLQFVLLLLCLRLTGGQVDLLTAFVAFAVGRFLTVLPITPGGLGVAETGTATVLVTLGVAAATANAAVLLFTLFVVLLEIPVGAVSLVTWWYRYGRGRGTAAATPV
jgi:putative heme transporter